jgi:hypothetical protein
MTDNITLPRDVGEHLFSLVLDRIDGMYHATSEDEAALDALDAALAEPDAALEAQEDEALLNEPIAMRYDGDGYGYLYIDSGSGSDWQRRHKDAEPLYLAPPKPDATREPATEKQVAEVFKLSGAVYWGHYRNGWREAERFHGITKEDGK